MTDRTSRRRNPVSTLFKSVSVIARSILSGAALFAAQSEDATKQSRCDALETPHCTQWMQVLLRFARNGVGLLDLLQRHLQPCNLFRLIDHQRQPLSGFGAASLAQFARQPFHPRDELRPQHLLVAL